MANKNNLFKLEISYNLMGLIEQVLDRIEDLDNYTDEDVFQAINDSIIYYDDQWAILHEYCLPQNADWEYAIEQFENDVFSALVYIKE